MPITWSIRQSASSDAAWIAELRAKVMRPDLERLEIWDPQRVRQRFLEGFSPDRTYLIDVDHSAVGVIAVRPESDAVWIEHFYIEPALQGQGLGGEVLRWAMETHRDGRPFRLNVLQGSKARRLYQRHGFVFEHEDPIDVFLIAATAESGAHESVVERP